MKTLTNKTAIEINDIPSFGVELKHIDVGGTLLYMKKEFVLGELTLIEKLPVEKLLAPNTKTGWIYYYKAKYLCFCGNEFIAKINDVKVGHTKSCGCYVKIKCKNVNTTHGLSKDKLYQRFHHIRKRCYSIKDKFYKDYGGRGITMCEEWRNSFKTFYNWAIKNGYKEELSIDRINNDGNYEPSNCRWVNQKIQSINQRIRKNKSGAPGVAYLSRIKLWEARISVNNKKISVGKFDTIEEASEAYQKAKKERDEQYHKEFIKNGK